MILLQVNLRLTINTILYLIKSLRPISSIGIILKLNSHFIQILLPQRVHLHHLLQRALQVKILHFLLAGDGLVLQHKEQRVVHYTILAEKERILLKYTSKLIFLLIREVDQSVIQIFVNFLEVHIFHYFLVAHDLAFLRPPFSILAAKFNFAVDGAAFDVEPHLWVVFVF